ERPISKSDRASFVPGDHHSFLILAIQVAEGGDLEIVQEIHFNSQEINGKPGPLFAYTRPPGRDISSVKLWGHIGGDAQEIGRIWNDALKAARRIKNLKLQFSEKAGPEAINCRA